MPLTYRIKKKEKGTVLPWEDLASAQIINYQWENNDYCPKAFGKACYDEQFIYFQLSAFEKEVKAQYTKMNEPVYKDSCLECFIQVESFPGGRYLNFEFNSKGILLLGLGKNRDNRSSFTEEALKYFDIRAFDELLGDLHHWGVSFHLPIIFLQEINPDFKLFSGRIIKGNFYKCGDETRFPHFGSWNPIASDEADFHLSEHFGDWILE